MWVLVLCLVLVLEGSGAAPPVQSRIIGGWECEVHSHPWQAAVYHYSSFECGGVLVHPQWVLTAAHCMSNYYQVWLGRHDLMSHEDTAQFVLVAQSFPHPLFNKSLLNTTTHSPGEDYSHDLMLLQLAQPAQLSGAVQVLELPTQEPRVGSTCYAAGWGTTNPSSYSPPDELQCVDLTLLPNKNCQEAHLELVTDTMLCAGVMAGGKDTCVGDSGGPLICDGVFQGVTSWGSYPCAPPNVPSIYTKLIYYVPWIQETIAAHS